MNLQLSGQVDTRDQQIGELEEENDHLSTRVRDLEMELSRTKRENQRAIAALRQILSPLRSGINAIFGEMDAIGGEALSETPAKNAKWEAVKQRLSPRLREVIDLLLIQGTMGRKQIAAALKMDYSNCTKNVIGILIRQGWLIDSGRDGVSLKEL